MPADQTHTKFLLSILGLVLIVPLLAFGVIQLEGPRIRADVQADLAAIARLKASQIESWLGERRNHALTLMTSDSFVGAVERWFVNHSPEAAAHIDSRLAAIRRAYGYQAELIDPRDLDAEGSDPTPGLSRAEQRTLLNRALASGEAQMSELYRDPQGQVWLEQIIPLSRNTPRGPRVAGAVALRMPAGAFLFPLIQTWPTPSPSGETLLIRRDGDQVLFLNELRHRQGTALKLRLPLDSPELPAAIALRRGGGTQFIEGRDYRGVDALMSSQPVAGMPWLVAAKIDRQEVLRPLYKLVGWVSLVALIGIVALGLVLMRLRRQELLGHQSELQVSSNERDHLLSLFYELPFMGMAIVEPTGCKFLQVNDRLCEILGYRRKELLGQSWVQFVPAEQNEACAHEHQRLLNGEIDSYQLEQRLLRKDGTSIDTALAARSVRRTDGSVEYVVKTLRDISERKQAEQQLQHLNRALRAYSSSGWALVHANDEANYLRVFCRILVEDCGHALIWIGQAEQDEARNIRPLAQAGFDDGYLDQLNLSWGDNPRGRGPSGTAVRDGQPVTCQRIDSDPAFRPWRDEALRHGYASSLALPVGLDGERVLVINIYSKQPEAFSEEEVRLLQKMADEMAYGLGVLRLRAERHRQQEDLQISEQRFRLLANATLEGIAISELGYLVDINQRLLNMFGYSREEVLDQPMTELLKTVAADLLSDEESARIQDNFRAGSESRFECPMRRKDGQVITVEVHGQTHVGDGRTFRITVLRDITERKWAENLLRRSQTQLFSFIEHAPLSIAMFNRKMSYLAYSRRWLEEYGAGHADLIGRNYYQVHPNIGEHWRAIHRRGLAGETLRSDEDRWPQEDGSERWMRWAVVPWRDENAEIGGIILSAEDITERKRIELELADSRARLAGIINSAMDAIITLDAQQRVRLFNPAAERMFGYRAEDMLGQSIEQLIPARLRQRHQQQMQAFSLTGQASMNIARPRELFALRHDGAEFPIEISISRADIGGEQLFTAILRDISERVASELALHEREVDLTRAQAVGHLGSWRLDVQRNELTWSEENHRIFEVPLGTAMTYEFFLSRVHPDDRAYVDLEWQAALRGEPYDIEHRLLVNGRVKWVREKATLEFGEGGELIGGFGITQDISDIKQAEQALRESEERFQLAAEIGHSGTWDWDLLNDAMIWSRGYFEILGYRQGEVEPGYQAWVERVHPDDRQRIETEIQHCMLQHRDYAAEFRVIWPDGSVHWMSAHGRFEYGNSGGNPGADNGSCTRMVGVMADITPQKLAELALREADQRKDEFLAMLAHELRNPLAPIRNAAHVLGRLELDEPRVRWAQDIIERQVSHLTHLVDELLDVSRIALGKITLKQVRVELADLVRQASESVQPLMSAKQHRFEVRLPSQTVPLMGDPVRLLQVLQNLLNNAAKYTPDGGHIELSAQCHGKQLELRVRDNGTGMPADLLPGVFDLFRQGERTLDRAQGGLGIGLTLVRRLVELHGGQVEAQSPGPGLGSTFCVRLPIANGLAQEGPTDATPVATTTSRLRVLVVDDDAVVAESMVVFLELEGHQVRSADSCHNALRLLESFRPQVVLLDIGLPGQDGYEVARLIQTQPGGEDVTLVAVSGYGHDEAVKRSLQSGFARHLIKPVDPEVLSALLAELSA